MSAGPTSTNGVAPGSQVYEDPRRWITLTIVIISAFIVVLDNTVLNVAIPTILREFHTTLPSLEWVVTGYALTFATFLIIGGRLGDVYGHRRVFIIGAALFGVGSGLASVSHSVGMMILGEAIIEGIGASLMLPATLAILSTTFHGRERATAFAAWGATAGVAAASGPVVGGFLTNFYSWRWAFRINVVIAPLAIIGALLFMQHGEPTIAPRQDRRSRCVVDRGRHVLPRVRAQRGRHLRMDHAHQGLQHRGARRVAGDARDLGDPDLLPRLRSPRSSCSSSWSGRRSATTAHRSSSSRTCASRRTATGSSPVS